MFIFDYPQANSDNLVKQAVRAKYFDETDQIQDMTFRCFLFAFIARSIEKHGVPKTG